MRGTLQGTLRDYIELGSENVGERFIAAFGSWWPTPDHEGVKAVDIGRRLYHTDAGLEVESAASFMLRLEQSRYGTGQAND